MERFSRFRDAGTGIQVFLNPVAPAGSASAAGTLLLPVKLVFGVVRIALVLVVGLLWTLLAPIVAPLGGSASAFINTIFGRMVLGALGLPLISQEVVSIKNRGRPTHTDLTASVAFKPQPGDIILCNWSSWIDVLFLLTRFNPVFIRPVVSAPQQDISAAASATASSATRRKNAATRGQQHAGMPASPALQVAAGGSTGNTTRGDERILGWKQASWLEMILRTGHPPEYGTNKAGLKSIDELVKGAKAPVVVFPELVTSNNRGLLRFEAIFPPSWRSLYRATGALHIGKGQANIFAMSIKHEAPSALVPSTTLSVPSPALSPLPHILHLCFTPAPLRPYSLSVRYLPADESLTHAAFVADAQAGQPSSSPQRSDPLSDKCADLVSSLSRLRRTDIDWQEKEAFLAMFRRRA